MSVRVLGRVGVSARVSSLRLVQEEEDRERVDDGKYFKVDSCTKGNSRERELSMKKEEERGEDQHGQEGLSVPSS